MVIMVSKQISEVAVLSEGVPYGKLYFIKEKIGLSEGDLQVLDPYREIFVQHKDQFAQHFYDVFENIPETHLILEHEGRPGFLKKAWAAWFEFFFRTRLDDTLLAYLWRIGVRHVEVNLDQRFSNLGFSVIRQFCYDIVLSEIPRDQAAPLLNILNKMLDLCLLIETEAYITHTTRCDLEVMKEVADRVRNPVTVIGGNIRRLQKKLDATSKEYDLLGRLFVENQRLERMMQDIRVYMEVFAGEPRVRKVDLDELIGLVLEKLRAEDPAARNGVNVNVNLDRRARFVTGDADGLQLLFYYLLQNSFEAVAPDTGFIEISSRLEDGTTRNMRVEIVNTGAPLETQEMERLFAPFYSTKVTGTGFGLAIAQVLARKHYGKIDLEPVSEGGMRVTVTLPRAERNGDE
jgi:signal transduction histidine kinase